MATNMISDKAYSQKNLILKKFKTLLFRTTEISLNELKLSIILTSVL